MEFDVWTRGLASLSVDCIVLGVFEDGELSGEARAVDSACGHRLKKLLDRGDFAGRIGDTLLVTDLPGIAASRVLLTGLGTKKQFQRKSWRRACQSALTAITRTRIASVAVAIDRPEVRELDDYYLGRQVAEITGAALYRVNDLKTGKKPTAPALRKVLAGPARKAARDRARARPRVPRSPRPPLIQRDLANLPRERVHADLPRRAGARARQAPRLLRCGCSRRRPSGARRWAACWRCRRAARSAPRFIVLEHRGGKRGEAPVVLVGKGVTFDSGGISLKDPPGMDEMKFDMSGGSGRDRALSVSPPPLDLKLNVVGLVAAVENMPGGRAVKPGDIATSAAGLTVEILNTDAEGRLILCDALHYARRFNPAAVVDVATLTGACVVALGHLPRRRHGQRPQAGAGAARGGRARR